MIQLFGKPKPVGRPKTRPGRVGRPPKPPVYGPARPVGRPRKIFTHEDKAKATKQTRMQYSEEKVEAIRERQRRYMLHYKYGITPEQKEIMWLAQNKRCFICRTPIELWGNCNTCAKVDHDHRTGQVRNLLCSVCNSRVWTVESGELQGVLAYARKWGINLTG